jgi:hypothetical protein
MKEKRRQVNEMRRMSVYFAKEMRAMRAVHTTTLEEIAGDR